MEVSVAVLLEEEKKLVELLGEAERKEFEEDENIYWVFTIGEKQNQCILVGDSETDEAVGILRK